MTKCTIFITNIRVSTDSLILIPYRNKPFLLVFGFLEDLVFCRMCTVQCAGTIFGRGLPKREPVALHQLWSMISVPQTSRPLSLSVSLLHLSADNLHPHFVPTSSPLYPPPPPLSVHQSSSVFRYPVTSLCWQRRHPFHPHIPFPSLASSLRFSRKAGPTLSLPRRTLIPR